MEIISYEYPKARRDFGIHPNFSDSVPTITSVKQPPESEAEEQWIHRVTTTVELDCIPLMAQHEANTEMFVQQNKGTSHIDGAWPPEVKTNEFVDRQRMLRRIKNDVGYQNSVCNLIKTAELAIQQNNTIDLYEDYFLEDNEEHASDPPSCKTVSVFRDPNEIKRAATKISWHPEGPEKLAVSYAIMEFQKMPDKMPMSSYIWDVNNPNQPDSEIIPQSPLTACVYNPRSPDHLVGGSYNGLVAFWDLRKGSSPVENSLLENSHHDPVYDIFWIQSRTGNECVSTSTDGQLLWWDTRKLGDGPTDSMLLSSPDDVIYGGTSMEYKSDAGATRYLVGTEQGVVLLCDRKAKKDRESQKSIKSTYGLKAGRHHGPIYSIQRNPSNPKFFLTVGDWTARVWMEDLKVPMLTTRYDNSYLTSGCWSTTRPGVFFTTKMDGTLDVWDYFYKHNTPTFSTKVGEVGLSSIRVQEQGKLVAVGSLDGTTTVLKINESLSEPQPNEKLSMATMFERETKREKNLELRLIQRKKAFKDAQRQKNAEVFDPTAEDDEKTKQMLTTVDEKFYSMINLNKEGGGDDEESENAEKEKGAADTEE